MEFASIWEATSSTICGSDKLDVDGGRQRVLPVKRVDDFRVEDLEVLKRLVLRGEADRRDAVMPWMVFMTVDVGL